MQKDDENDLQEEDKILSKVFEQLDGLHRKEAEIILSKSLPMLKVVHKKIDYEKIRVAWFSDIGS